MMILKYKNCYRYYMSEINPVAGIGFLQNLKAGTDINLGNIFLNFHDECDGKAYVEFANEKYLT